MGIDRKRAFFVRVYSTGPAGRGRYLAVAHGRNQKMGTVRHLALFMLKFGNDGADEVQQTGKKQKIG